MATSEAARVGRLCDGRDIGLITRNTRPDINGPWSKPRRVNAVRWFSREEGAYYAGMHTGELAQGRTDDTLNGPPAFQGGSMSPLWLILIAALCVVAIRIIHVERMARRHKQISEELDE